MAICETCKKQIVQRPAFSGCDCLLSEMICHACGKTVQRTGRCSDGHGLYAHAPCGSVSEEFCRDPRPCQLRLL